MKKRSNLLGLLTLFLLSPSLMALEESPASSSYIFTNEGFEISYREVEDIEYQDLYEITVKNTGEKYINKTGIYIGGDAVMIHPIPRGNEYRFGDTLVKPGETAKIYSQFNVREKQAIRKENVTFTVSAYKPRNDLRVASGPFDLSITQASAFTSILNIKCNKITQLMELEDNGYSIYNYYYAVSLTYDGEEFCILSSYQLGEDIVPIYYDHTLELDLNKITINQIDTFYEEVYMMDECIVPKKLTLWPIFVGAGVAASIAVSGFIYIRYRNKKEKGSSKVEE